LTGILEILPNKVKQTVLFKSIVQTKNLVFSVSVWTPCIRAGLTRY